MEFADQQHPVGRRSVRSNGQNERGDGRSETGQDERSEGGRHVDLWIRRDLPNRVRDVPEETHEQLQRLQETGRIDSLSLRVWRDSDIFSDEAGTAHAETCRDTIAEFAAWASDHGCTLSPGFQTRETNPMVTETVTETLLPPILCLAVYSDDALEAVFPYSDGERVYTVADGLERLESGDLDSLVRGERS